VTRRLLFVPAVVGVIGGVAATLYLSGLLWPIAGQVWSLIAPRPCNEADWMA
jgi:putative effector of murein hydrolase LrgA (UPF0299 family)